MSTNMSHENRVRRSARRKGCLLRRSRSRDLQAQGYRLCYWGVDTRDWSGVSAATIVNKVIHGDNRTPPARAGDSILMHMSNTQSRYALSTMIRALRAKGLPLERLR